MTKHSFLKSKIIPIFIGMIFLVFDTTLAFPQGFNHVWLLGYNNWIDKGRMTFTASSYSFNIEQRKMGFQGAEATISDANGNFLMSCNGEWIANANNDTMMNGTNLVPGNGNGILAPQACLILPYPNDSSKFAIFHHTYKLIGPYYKVTELLLTVVDMTLNSGLGGVILKSDTILNDTLNSGIAACKHANGRDWWIVMQKDSSNVFYNLLLTPNGISSPLTQNINITPLPWSNATQPTFSPDGTKFSFTYFDDLLTHYVFLFDFDRCSGIFSNPQTIFVSDGFVGFGCAFSANSNFIYATSVHKVFQIDVNSLVVDTVAVNDTFYSPQPNGFLTDFLLMYLAANGKIYITSGNAVQHIHFINYPDSAGMACDVQQHAINLGIWSFRAVPNHPNYYLGPVPGSICDSLGLDVNSLEQRIKNFQINPNPNNGNFSILYLLPQNRSGVFEVYDITGKKVFTYPLPPWSTLQHFDLSFLNEGIYQCIISSNGQRAVKKVVVIKD